MELPMPNARAPRVITRALVAALEDTAADCDVPNLRRIVDSLIGKAIGGDLAAIREIFDRVDGKATAAVPLDAESDDGEPRKIVFEWGTE
jgi:hypothetical protein